jgi:hypothetical protein
MFAPEGMKDEETNGSLFNNAVNSSDNIVPSDK